MNTYNTSTNFGCYWIGDQLLGVISVWLLALYESVSHALLFRTFQKLVNAEWFLCFDQSSALCSSSSQLFREDHLFIHTIRTIQKTFQANKSWIAPPTAQDWTTYHCISTISTSPPKTRPLSLAPSLANKSEKKNTAQQTAAPIVMGLFLLSQ